MKIFVDENIPLITVEALRALGHDVRDLRGTPSEELRDDALWEVTQREERLLITTDKGFAHDRMGPHHDMFEAAELRSKSLAAGRCRLCMAWRGPRSRRC